LSHWICARYGRHSLPSLPPSLCLFLLCLLFNDPAPTVPYTLSLHDALPIFRRRYCEYGSIAVTITLFRKVTMISELAYDRKGARSEEHTSELQSRFDLVCRLLLEKKNLHV